MAFMTLVLMEIIRLQMIRSTYRTGIFSNKWLVWAVAVSLGLQLAVIYTPLNILFKVAPLGGTHWLYMAVTLVVGYTVARAAIAVIGRTTREVC